MNCASCEDKICYSAGINCTEYEEEDLYTETDNLRVSSEIEALHYMKLSRLEEIILYCKKKGYKKLGIAFCIGLSEEAKILDEILNQKGFETRSVCCKVGGISKDELGISKILDERFEAICNPYLQAKILNDWSSDLNLIVGLCLGHDIDFSNNSDAPTTTFIVKDRMLAHNPAGALYSNYYRRKILKPVMIGSNVEDKG